MGTDAAVEFYQIAKQCVSQTSFSGEISWQATRDLHAFSESDLLRETAWVILCSGFRESVLRRSFSYISLCFCEWESAAVISENATLCRATALAGFRNPRKINAIINTARFVCGVGFATYRAAILEDPILALRSLPYIGEITAYHLAKNLGADVAKPDRHLSRLAESHGFNDAHALCSAIARATGDPLRVIDVILWRFLAENNHQKKEAERTNSILGLAG